MNRAIDICIYSLKNSLSLKGRTNRREYWLFILMFLIVWAVLLWFSAKIPAIDIFVKGYCILMLIPIFSATVRRLHDVEKSAKWMSLCLLPVFGWMALFVFTVGEGSESANRFGQRTTIYC